MSVHANSYLSQLSIQSCHLYFSGNKTDVCCFSLRQQTFFSRGFAHWVGKDKKSLNDNRCHDQHCHDTDALPLNAFFFCWVRYVTEEVWQKLSWKWQPYLFWFGLIPMKWKQAMRILKMQPFASIVLLQKYCSSHSFACIKFLVCYKHVHPSCCCAIILWFISTLYTLTSVGIFSIQFSLDFLRF